MDVKLVLPRSLRLPLLYIGLGAVFALGCSSPVPVETTIDVEAESCADNVLAMSFDVISTNALFPGVYQYGTPNVIPFPTTSAVSGGFHVVAALDSVMTGESVQMTFSASAFGNSTISIQNIQFYTVPPAQIHFPACPPTQGVTIATGEAPGLGFHMEVSNPSADPMVIDQMEMAEAPTLLAGPQVHFGSPDLEGLAWSPTSLSGTVLAPGTPPIIVDLPDIPTPGTDGVLMRYVMHSSSGAESSCIVQVDLSSLPVPTRPSTWGAVKALYRDNQ